MTLDEFDTNVREAYITGVAQALSTQVSNVVIGSVTQAAVLRRLLTASIDVKTIVTVPRNEAESMATSITTEILSNELGPTIPVGGISTPVTAPVTTQITCGAGTYSSFDKTVCVTCPSGTYSAELGATSFSTCTKCPVSTYSAVIGATSSTTCTPCEIGKVTSRPGSTWAAQCVVTPSINMC
jgi:hypothetical protein